MWKVEVGPSLWPEKGQCVIAADLSQPFLPPLPPLPNLKTVQSNAEEDRPFKQENTFIYGRMLASAIRDWPAFTRRSWDHLEPGGWLELKDVSYLFRAAIPAADNLSESPRIRWGYLSDKGWAANGKDFTTTSKHVQPLQALGFVYVKRSCISP